MTAAEMLTWFDILQDKFNTPYFTDLEKYDFLNDAQLNFVNDYLNLNDDDVAPVFEANALKDTIISPLLFSDVTTTASVGGVVLTSAVETAIDTQYSLSGSKIIYIISISVSGVPVSFVRHGDLIRQEQNNFTKAVNTIAQKYRISRDQFDFTPQSASNYEFTGIKMPIDIAAGIDSELPLSTHRKNCSISTSENRICNRASSIDFDGRTD